MFYFCVVINKIIKPKIKIKIENIKTITIWKNKVNIKDKLSIVQMLFLSLQYCGSVHWWQSTFPNFY